MYVESEYSKHEKRVAKFFKDIEKRRTGRNKGRGNLLRASKRDFYRSKEWMRLRRYVIQVYGYKCMKCGEVNGKMHVDHIKPRSKFPDLALTFSNMQVLCKGCNEKKSNYHCGDYREEAIALEIDRETALMALSLGL